MHCAPKVRSEKRSEPWVLFDCPCGRENYAALTGMDAFQPAPGVRTVPGNLEPDSQELRRTSYDLSVRRQHGANAGGDRPDMRVQ